MSEEAGKPKRQRKGVKTNRKELALKMAKATDLYIEGCPPRRIAPLVERSPTSVVRWMKKMKITPPEVKVQELWEANHIKDEAYRIHQQCREVEVVAMRLETPLHTFGRQSIWQNRSGGMGAKTRAQLKAEVERYKNLYYRKCDETVEAEMEVLRQRFTISDMKRTIARLRNTSTELN